MALGTILGAAAAAGTSALAHHFLGGKASNAPSAALMTPTSPVSKAQLDQALGGLNGAKFTGFNGGGLSSTMNNGTIGVNASTDRLGVIGKLANLFPEFGDQYAQLRARLDPASGALKTAALSEIENTRTRAIGNLRDNLQRRRVLGSSFAQDTLANAEAEFAQQRAKTSADIDMQAIEATQQLLGQELEVRQGEFTTWLGELNLQAGLSAELASAYQSETNANARALAAIIGNLTSNSQNVNAANLRQAATLAAEADKGQGALLSELTKPLASAFGSGVQSLFS
jgi:hypothetical protein